MTTRETIIRYYLVIDKIRRQPSTFEEISAYLKSQSELRGYNFSISKRTFQRDINYIFSIFSIEVKYDNIKKAYCITDDWETGRNDRILEALDIFNVLNISEKNSPYIILESRKSKGTEHFYGLLQAIKNSCLVSFIYTKFWDDDVSVRTVEPYALKESRHRWYLIAKDNKDGVVKTFGLDRISELEILKQKFSYPENFNPNSLFRDCFGVITGLGSAPEDVILSFDPFQGKYVKSFPLHESQEIINDSDAETRIKLRVHITPDFLKELLYFGDELTVIAPESLKMQVRSILENTLKNNS